MLDQEAAADAKNTALPEKRPSLIDPGVFQKLSDSSHLLPGA
ncbi:hypothetical protein [Leisingera caerulea]|nr:hypothetical protein [Leisingera caerulea]